MQDHAGAALAHGRNEAARQPDGRHHMQVPIALPLLVRGFHDGLVGARAGIVDQDVGATEGGVGFVDQFLRAFHRADVAGNPERAYAEMRGDAARLGGDAFALARRQDDMAAFRRQSFGNGEADADAAAGDDRDLALQSEIHARFS